MVIAPLLAYLGIFGIRNLILLLLMVLLYLIIRISSLSLFFIPTLTVEQLLLVLFPCFCSLPLLYLISLQFKCWLMFVSLQESTASVLCRQHQDNLVFEEDLLDLIVSCSKVHDFITYLYPFALSASSPSIYCHFLIITHSHLHLLP